MSDNTVNISEERLIELLEAEALIEALFSVGVETWEGYEEALALSNAEAGYDEDRELTAEEYAAFDCLDCNRSTLELREYYMVQFVLWDQVHPENKGMLCIECLEKRLGRKLTSTDFTECPLNEINKTDSSLLLMTRLAAA
jgi:hypothetical protein